MSELNRFYEEIGGDPRLVASMSEDELRAAQRNVDQKPVSAIRAHQLRGEEKEACNQIVEQVIFPSPESHR